MYRPVESYQMTTPMQMLLPVTDNILGVVTKTWKEGDIISVNFKTYGGTERVINGLLAVEDTASIVCWYRPDIQSDIRLKRMSDGAVFEVMGDPEDIEQRHMILKFKVRRLKGGA